MKIALHIAYDGTNYCGWQKQKNLSSISEIIENAFWEKFNEKITLIGSGRTDAGVHAICQVAHFETNLNIKPESISLALNTILPQEIKVLKSFEVNQDFHARFSAKKKTYIYLAYVSKTENVFLVNRALQVKQSLDLDKMKNVANDLLGKHDFTSFCKQKSSVKDCIREIFEINIKQNNELGIISFEITGNGFLHNMVRILVSTLIDVGKGKLTKSDVKKILESKNRKMASRTLPAYALYMKEVFY